MLVSRLSDSDSLGITNETWLDLRAYNCSTVVKNNGNPMVIPK